MYQDEAIYHLSKVVQSIVEWGFSAAFGGFCDQKWSEVVNPLTERLMVLAGRNSCDLF